MGTVFSSRNLNPFVAFLVAMGTGISRMNVVRVAAAAGIILLPNLAAAQDQGRVSSGEVVSSATVPAPENGNIIVRFGEATRVYFKRPIKSIKLEDELVVHAVPQSDHIVAFTGLAPGKSTVTIESTSGASDSWGLVTVVRDPHVVRVYQPSQTNKQTGERRSDSSSDIGGYVALQCNEIKCDEVEPELQPKLPR
jgi:hypothetical protein